MAVRPYQQAFLGAVAAALTVAGALAGRGSVPAVAVAMPPVPSAPPSTACPPVPESAPTPPAPASTAPPPPGGWYEVGGTPAPPAQNASGLGTLAYSPAGVLTAGTDEGVWQYVAGRWSRLGTGLPPLDPLIASLTFAPDGAPVVGVADAGVWELRAGQWTELGGAGAPTGRDVPYALAFAPCGGDLLAGTESGLWSFADGEWTRVGGAGLPAGPYSVQTLGVAAGETAITIAYAHDPADDGVWLQAGGLWRRLPDPGPAVNHLAFSPDGTLIAATMRGVWRLTGGAWRQVGGGASPLADDMVRQLVFSPVGALTVDAQSRSPAGIGAARGIWRYEGGAWHPLGGTDSPLTADSVAALAYASDGALAASTILLGPVCSAGAAGLTQQAAGDGVWQFQGGTWKPLPGGGDPLGSVPALLVDTGGRLTAGTSGGVYQYSGDAWERVGTRTGPLAFAFVTGLALSPSGTLAAAVHGVGPCGTRAGVWLRRAQGWTDAANPGAMGAPTSVAYAPDGTLFAGGAPPRPGSAGGGVWRYAQGTWSEVGGSGSPLDQVGVWAVALSPQQTLTAGTDRGVWQFGGSAWTRVGGAQAPETGIVDALAFCPDGALLAGTSGGLWEWADNAWSAIAGPPGAATAVACSRSGSILSGGLGSGAWRTVGDGAVPLGGASSAIAHKSVVSLAIGPDGTVYAGTNNYGVWAYPPMEPHGVGTAGGA